MDKPQNVFDRFTALQHNSLYTIDGNVSGNWLDNGITVKPQFITTMGLKELQEEFLHIAIDEEGLIIRD